MENPNVERVRELCRQLESTEAELLAILSEAKTVNNPSSPWRKNTAKPASAIPSGRGRKKRIRSYICDDCGKPFTTNLPPSLARCLVCKSRNLTEGEMNGVVHEEINAT